MGNAQPALPSFQPGSTAHKPWPFSENDMQGLDVIELFDEPLALAPLHPLTEAYMPKPRSHDPRTQVRGTLAFPLTHQVAENLATHGEEWTRQFYLERGLTRFELDILIAGARKVS